MILQCVVSPWSSNSKAFIKRSLTYSRQWNTKLLNIIAKRHYHCQCSPLTLKVSFCIRHDLRLHNRPHALKWMQICLLELHILAHLRHHNDPFFISLSKPLQLCNTNFNELSRQLFLCFVAARTKSKKSKRSIFAQYAINGNVRNWNYGENSGARSVGELRINACNARDEVGRMRESEKKKKSRRQIKRSSTENRRWRRRRRSGRGGETRERERTSVRWQRKRCN